MALCITRYFCPRICRPLCITSYFCPRICRPLCPETPLSCTSIKMKYDVGCRADTMPKTVDTRRHCEEHATIFRNQDIGWRWGHLALPSVTGATEKTLALGYRQVYDYHDKNHNHYLQQCPQITTTTILSTAVPSICTWA